MGVFLLATLGNFWIWRILITNIIIATLLFFASWGLYFHKKYFWIFFCLLLFFQFKTTPQTSLLYLDNDQQRLVQMRLREYPYDLTRLGHIIEERPEPTIFFKVRENIFQNLDINHFFFAGFPRQTVGINEFEKLPYIFFPFFIIGLVKSLKEKIDPAYLASIIVPLLLLGIIGNNNLSGPFSLFPFLVVNIARGIKTIKEK